MSGVFQNIDPPPPHRQASVYPPPPLVRGEDTLFVWRVGWGGVNIFEDARHSSVLYKCKYFVGKGLQGQTFNFLIFKYSVSIRLLHTF
jgi:hypothetical protein